MHGRARRGVSTLAQVGHQFTFAWLQELGGGGLVAIQGGQVRGLGTIVARFHSYWGFVSQCKSLVTI